MVGSFFVPLPLDGGPFPHTQPRSDVVKFGSDGMVMVVAFSDNPLLRSLGTYLGRVVVCNWYGHMLYPDAVSAWLGLR